MEGQNFDVPTNVVIVHSAPHDIVMKQVSLVVTHGGHGTVARALSHVVPLLVIPMGRDQGDNAARVIAHGAGLTLTTDAAKEAIASAVIQLIAKPHFPGSGGAAGRSHRQRREVVGSGGGDGSGRLPPRAAFSLTQTRSFKD
jgi:UDP:flavonoid glycosyltransferase YjiC (YdhE family)